MIERLYDEVKNTKAISYPFRGIQGKEDFETLLHRLGKEELFGALSCVNMY